MARTAAKEAAPEPAAACEGAIAPAKPPGRGRGKKPTQPCQAEKGPTEDKLRVYRERLRAIVDVLESMFGKWENSNPDLWDRRAYLLLVGVVYERMATDVELPTEELVRLAKALADNRRVDSRSDKETVGPDASELADADGRLPARLAEAVHQVYGTNLNVTELSEHDQSRT